MTASKKRKKAENLIDPIYYKFTKSIIRTLGRTDFYEFFMDTISRADNQFQFSNRKMEKIVDLSWVDAVEQALPGFQNIIANPRNIIKEEELIVNVAHAKKAGADVVRHLAQHSALVENYDEETGEVRPSKLMQKFREDSTELYENRLVYTVLENAYHFVQIRHDALMQTMSEEYGAKLKVTSDLDSARERIHVDTYIHINEKETMLETDEKHREVFDRISRIYRLLGTFMDSPFAQQNRQLNRVKGNVMKTNILKKNPDYKKVVALWEFLRQYDDVGYLIKVTEQNPYVDERLQQDIYHNIMFQYLILKGYLEDEEDRKLPQPATERKRQLKPKFIQEIIEEMTEDYDLPDLEIRKVLIEELTKEQLMLEEEQERLRLVEEQEQRRKEEEEQRLLEEERLRKEQEEEEERLREEREEQAKKERIARMERELEDRRRCGIFQKDLEYFERHKLQQMEMRREEEEQWSMLEPKSDFANAAKELEEAEQRKREEEERERQRILEERERQRRLEEEKQEKERRTREEEARKEQIARDMEMICRYLEEAKYFAENIEQQKKSRADVKEAEKLAYEQFLMERQMQQEEPSRKRWRLRVR